MIRNCCAVLAVMFPPAPPLLPRDAVCSMPHARRRVPQVVNEQTAFRIPPVTVFRAGWVTVSRRLNWVELRQLATAPLYVLQSTTHAALRPVHSVIATPLLFQSTSHAALRPEHSVITGPVFSQPTTHAALRGVHSVITFDESMCLLCAWSGLLLLRRPPPHAARGVLRPGLKLPRLGLSRLARPSGNRNPERRRESNTSRPSRRQASCEQGVAVTSTCGCGGATPANPSWVAHGVGWTRILPLSLVRRSTLFLVKRYRATCARIGVGERPLGEKTSQETFASPSRASRPHALQAARCSQCR